MEDQPTCGKGLAANAVLPARLEQVTAAMAEVLEVHMKALVLSDPHARAEYDAYAKLAERYRQLASDLRETSAQMAGYRSLPMGTHDAKAMASSRAVNAFTAFAQAKQELLALLQTTAEQDQQMLASMRTAGR